MELAASGSNTVRFGRALARECDRRPDELPRISFAEDEGPWSDVPRWVTAFIRLGYSWPGRLDTRRIGLVSVPCDSPAAGLIALGAMRRRHEFADANDETRHYQRLRGLATDSDCSSVLRHRSMPWRFRPELDGRRDIMWACRLDTKGQEERWAILEHHAHEWFVEGEAPVEVLAGQRLCHGALLSGILEGAGAIIESTLTRSDAATCLAGRVAGEARTRRLLSAIRFRFESESADVAQLLSVHEWQPGLVSRVTFFNSRTRRMDRLADPPQIVIVDGGTALLRVLEHEAFRGSDVIAVIPRDADHDELEDVAQRIASLAQWYGEDPSFTSALPMCPPGVSTRVLVRR